MEIGAYKAFVSMYYALDAAFDTNKSDELDQFLSDANPFLFTDEGSADVAVFEEFKESYPDDADEVAALRYVRDYLARQNMVLLDAFDSVASPDAWKTALE